MEASDQINLLNPELSIIILTWVSFFLLLFILRKFAWSPILIALDKREETIRQSLDDAQKLKEELSKIHETYSQKIKEAQKNGEEIIERSHRAALEAAKIVEQKAKEETKILLENAHREIKEEQDRVLYFMKEESANIAIHLASKLIKENLDNEKNRHLINQFIKEI